jgi:hypothetical protein
VQRDGVAAGAVDRQKDALRKGVVRPGKAHRTRRQIAFVAPRCPDYLPRRGRRVPLLDPLQVRVEQRLRPDPLVHHAAQVLDEVAEDVPIDRDGRGARGVDRIVVSPSGAASSRR